MRGPEGIEMVSAELPSALGGEREMRDSRLRRGISWSLSAYVLVAIRILKLSAQAAADL